MITTLNANAYRIPLADGTVQCPDCAGTGAQIVNTGLMPEHGNLEQWSCDRCSGIGELELNHAYIALAQERCSGVQVRLGL